MDEKELNEKIATLEKAMKEKDQTIEENKATIESLNKRIADIRVDNMINKIKPNEPQKEEEPIEFEFD